MNCEHCGREPGDFGMRKFGHVTVAGRRWRLCPVCSRNQREFERMRRKDAYETAHRHLD